MSEDDQPSEKAFFHAVVGLLARIAPDRSDVLLVEIKTLEDTFRLAMPKSVALKVAASIVEEANKLTPDHPAAN